MEYKFKRRKIHIIKESCAKGLYTKINLDALQAVMTNPRLTPAEFQFWIYLSKNQQDFDLDLSPANAANWGISRPTFYRAINTLIDEGYLVPEYKGSNNLLFYEYPQTQKNKTNKKQNWLDSKTFKY